MINSKKAVIPAEAGSHNVLQSLDSRLRGNDGQREIRTFYEALKNGNLHFITRIGS